MKAVFEDFDDRVREVDRFLELIAILERPQAELTSLQKNVLCSQNVGADWIRTMKAAAFLLLYNLIEGSVRRGIGAVYAQIKTDKEKYAGLIVDLRDLWIRQEFRRVDPWSASFDKYRDVARDIAATIVNEAVIEFDETKLPVSGNLDAEKVLRICELHAIATGTHYHRATNGTELSTVVRNRNQLAHGNMSFAECGRQYTITEITQIKEQVVVFVRSVLRDIDKYIQDKNYAA